jgi:poly(A) polymerase
MSGREGSLTMLRAVTEVLRRRGTTGWLVGGSVRDRALGRFSPDVDVAVMDDAAAVAKEVAAALESPWFGLSERHPAYRVLGPGGYVDVAAVRGGGITADLALRDFTVNAMAVPLDGVDLLDPFGGLAHLREGRLVAVSPTVFTDDPLRLMRAPRFCHVLGLRLDEALTDSIRVQAAALSGAAAERVASEMALTLASGRAAEAVRLWHGLGLLVEVLPEFPVQERLESTLALLDRLDDLLERPAVWFPGVADVLGERMAIAVDGATSRPVALRWAGLMHVLSDADVETAARRLRLSGAMVSLLSSASRFLRAGEAGTEEQDSGRPAASQPAPGWKTSPVSKRTDVLFLWGTAPWEPEVTALVAAAATSGNGTGSVGRASIPDSDRLVPARRLMDLWAGRARDGAPPPPLDGEDLMRELGLPGGPLLGKVLREARLAWEAGEATTSAEFLAAARRGLEAG